MKNFIEILENQVPVASVNINHIVSLTAVEDEVTHLLLSTGETMPVNLSYDEVKKLIEAESAGSFLTTFS